jgi:hypothetical protein
MSFRRVWTRGTVRGGDERLVERPRTIWLFVTLAVANLAVTAGMNTWVLTDDVYRSLLGGPTARNDALITMTRGWELIGYALSPALLFARVGGAALMVQLGLLLMGRRLPLARIFRAGVWAQTSLLTGALAQLTLLASTPAAGRTAERLRDLPGNTLALTPDPGALSPGLALLLERVTVFDLGWIALFVLALEHRDDAPAVPTLVAVTATALVALLLQWTAAVYLWRLG